MVVRKYGDSHAGGRPPVFSEEQEARDAVQEAMLSAFKGIRNFAGEAQLWTWLHRVVVNASLTRLRQRRRHSRDSLEDLLLHFDGAGNHLSENFGNGVDLVELIEWRDRRAMVSKCIAMLPENYRTVLLLRDIEEMSIEAVAQALGETPNAVKVRLHRARQALRTVLQRALNARSDRSVSAS
jgi:RNA polymerase sigma-70 factor (ECF subfamily)